MSKVKRDVNERKFSNWEDRENGRLYWFEIEGKYGWKAKYLKLVDENDSTLKFWQEIYDNLGKLVEIHEKYPVDKGHVKLSDNDK